MKPAFLTKLSQACCVAAIIIFGAMRTEAQTNNFVFPRIGTYSNVLNYAVSNVNVIVLFAFIYDTNGQQKFYSGPVWYGSSTNPLTSKFQLDQEVIAPEIANVLQSVCTNENPIIDKSKGVAVYVGCDLRAGGSISYDNIYAYKIIQLVSNQDGSYSVPDLSSFSTILADYISFYVPDLQWARVEVGYSGDSIPFEVDDQRSDPSSDPIDDQGFLEIATSYLTNSSTGGDFWLKTTVLGDSFQIFDGNGDQIPETSFQLAMSQDSTNAYITVSGGDSGRGYLVQSSVDLKSWTNCSSVTFISPTNDLPNAVPSQFIYSLTNHLLFFRTATTNLPPM